MFIYDMTPYTEVSSYRLADYVPWYLTVKQMTVVLLWQCYDMKS